MDQPGLDANVHRRALEGLRTTNSICRTAQVIWRRILDANMFANSTRPLRILDVACGGGDVLLAIAKFAAKRGARFVAHGCDISRTAVDHARAAARQSNIPNVEFFQHDALTGHLPKGYDLLMCTLFLHHLSEVDARDLLQCMAQATNQYILIDDLRRTRAGYVYAWAGGRLISRSRIVHTDGPLSVRAAFTIEETRKLACEAGLQNAQFRRHWPERFLMSWKKNLQ